LRCLGFEQLGCSFVHGRGYEQRNSQQAENRCAPIVCYKKIALFGRKPSGGIGEATSPLPCKSTDDNSSPAPDMRSNRQISCVPPTRPAHRASMPLGA
jgi:hypothetical protein